MARARITTDREVRPDQLKAELGGADVFTSEGIVEAEGVSEVTLQTAVDTHTPDPAFGAPAEEVSLRDDIAQRLQALDDATRTQAAWNGLTAAQRQEVTRQAIQGFVRLCRFIARRFL